MFCTFWLLRNSYSGDPRHANYAKHSLHHHFQHCAKRVNQIYSLWKLFEIGVCFCTFLLLWNFCSGDAHHANYGKHTLNHHFQHSANCVYQIYSVWNLFEIAVRFAHLAFTKFLLWWCAPWKLQWTLFKSSFPILRKLCKWDLQHMRFSVFSNLSKLHLVLHILAFTKSLLRWCPPCKLWEKLFTSSFPTLRKLVIYDLQRFEIFPNCCLFCTIWLLRNFNSGDAHHSNYWELCLNHHSFHCSHCVNKIYSVLKPFEITVCFGKFGFYEISTPVMRTILTMANNV